MPQCRSIGSQQSDTLPHGPGATGNHVGRPTTVEIEANEQGILNDGILASVKELPTVHVGKSEVAITIRARKRITHDFGTGIERDGAKRYFHIQKQQLRRYMVFAFDVLVTGFRCRFFFTQAGTQRQFSRSKMRRKGSTTFPADFRAYRQPMKIPAKSKGCPPKGNPCHYIIMYARNQSISSSAS